MSTIAINKSNFQEEIMESTQPVILDFWAPWCGPCRMLTPILEEISDEHNNLKVCKINIDEESSLAQAFHIMSIPTLIAMDSGKIKNQSIGLITKEKILEMI